MNMKKEKCRHQLFDYEADYVICTAGLFLPLIFPCYIGLWVAVIGILATYILPGFLSNPNHDFVSADLSPIDFPHLIERLFLLDIITFG